MDNNQKPVVLVVDDKVENCRMASMVLQKEGYHVLTANGGNEGILLAKTGHPDIVLLDVSMPDLDGYQVLSRLKVDLETKEIPIVMLTSHGEEKKIAASYEKGAVAYVQKPYEVDDLIRTVQMALASRGLSGA